MMPLLALPGPTAAAPPPPPELGMFGRALASGSFRAVARESLQHIGHEALFASDVFVKIFASILVMRAITHLVDQWWGSAEAWNQSDTLLKSFSAAPAPEAELTDQPKLMLEHMGYRFYHHKVVFQGQPMGPCPLRLAEPCMRCEWFVRGNDGRPWCAAMTKLATARHEVYGRLDIFEVRDLLRQQHTGTTNPQP